jgi:excisionase family DNA binding protein
MVVIHEREPVIAPDKDTPVIRKLNAVLAEEGEGIAQLITPSGKSIKLPHSVFSVLVKVVREMARNSAVRVMPIHAELTTQEAADLLNVSRPFLITLLEQGAIPYHMVGTHRRILLKDLRAYKATRDNKRRQLLDEMARDAQGEGFYED